MVCLCTLYIIYIRLSASKPLVFLLVSLRSFHSSLEGAVKLKFAPFAPLEMCFYMVSFFAKVKFFRF